MKKARKGAMMMEYVVLLGSMYVLVTGVALATYDYQLGTGFGEVGLKLAQLYQRIVTVISLPVP